MGGCHPGRSREMVSGFFLSLFFFFLSQRPTLFVMESVDTDYSSLFFILVSSMKKKFEKEAMENES
jgi:hypothetical protein